MFLMHRVELKVAFFLSTVSPLLPFLMHRVELKETSNSQFFYCLLMYVPNAPCGVESKPTHNHTQPTLIVPNAPCGVESVKLKD